MNIFQAIKRLHPTAEQPHDFEVRDDGNGPYLAVWRVPGPQPTAQQLTDAWTALEAERVAAETATATEESAIDTIIAALEAGATLTAAQRRRLDLFLVRYVRRQRAR